MKVQRLTNETNFIMFIQTDENGNLALYTSEKGYKMLIDLILKQYRMVELDYNLDTSAGHPVKDDDIVRYSFEKRRVKDKEP